MVLLTRNASCWETESPCAWNGTECLLVAKKRSSSHTWGRPGLPSATNIRAPKSAFNLISSALPPGAARQRRVSAERADGNSLRDRPQGIGTGRSACLSRRSPGIGGSWWFAARAARNDWRTAPTCAPCNRCWAMPISQLLKFTRMFSMNA